MVGTKDNKQVEQSVFMPGTPKKLSLETEQTTIVANRSGIAILKANILDENNHPVFDATNTLHWKVEGPATLVGASVYESDIMKHEEWEGTGYTIVPVCNIIRSSNTTGIIKITVSSPGLEAATIEINSIAPAQINSPIIEFNLESEGRKNITKDTSESKSVKVLTGIMNIRENHKIRANNLDQIKRELNGFIRHRNYGLDNNSVGVKMFVEILSDKVQKQNGELIADDYNFLAGQFNAWFTLEQMIIRSNIPKEKHARLLENYADIIILKANPVDLDKEKELILGSL